MFNEIALETLKTVMKDLNLLRKFSILYSLTADNHKERQVLKGSTDWFFFAKKVANPLFFGQAFFKDVS